MARLLLGLCGIGTLGLTSLGLAGCLGSSGGGNQVSGEHRPCNTDGDCEASGEVCSAHKVCLPRAIGAHSFGLELRPPSDAELQTGVRLAQHELAPLDVDLRAGGVVVEMPEAVHLTGKVAVVDSVPVQATVTVSRASRIPGRPKVLLSQSVIAEGVVLQPNRDEVTPTFDVLISEDATYTLRATPDAPFEQMYFPITTELWPDGDVVHWLVFGDPEGSIYAKGSVVDSLGAGVPDVRVKAVDGISGQRLSSIGVTDRTGTFRLLLPREIRSYTLSFGPNVLGVAVPEIIHQNVIIGLMAEEQGAEHGFDNPELLGTFQLPAYPTPQRFSFQLLGRSSSGEEVAIPGASVTFATSIGHEATLVGTFVTNAVSEDDGLVAVDLVPGTTGQARTYDVVIVPPAGSEFASEGLIGERAVEVGATGGVGQVLQLSRRVAFTGAVYSAGLRAVTDVIVQSRRLDGSEGIRGSLRSTTTKQDGRFSLWLDPGRHAIELLPPTGLPLPRWLVPEELIVMESSSQIVDVASLILPGAEVLEVQVVTSSAPYTPVAGVVVAVYLVSPFCAALNPLDYALCDREPMFLGEATSDAVGRARVVVPGP